MRKRWIALLLILLSLSLVALAVSAAESSSGGSGGSGGGNGVLGDTDGGDSGGAEVTSWVDPHTGIDIFGYENVLSFENGARPFYHRANYDEEWISYGAGAKCTDAETVNIPANVASFQFYVDLGTYMFESGYTYYCYYRQHPTGEWLPLIVNYAESMIHDPRALSLGINTGEGGENQEHGFTVMISGERDLQLMNGLSGTMDYIVTGTFSVRIIKVPT